MRLGDRLKELRDKLAGRVGQGTDKTARDDTDCSAAPGANKPQPMSMSEADLDAAGFPEQLR
jgi:hypothetical protein